MSHWNSVHPYPAAWCWGAIGKRFSILQICILLFQIVALFYLAEVSSEVILFLMAGCWHLLGVISLFHICLLWSCYLINSSRLCRLYFSSFYLILSWDRHAVLYRLTLKSCQSAGCGSKRAFHRTHSFSHTHGSSQLSLIQVPGDLTPSLRLCRHCIPVVHRRKYIYKLKKKNSIRKKEIQILGRFSMP